ncbi:hypothetical protein B0T18DRAFT_396426, partial [Schizothecium vesticola]
MVVGWCWGGWSSVLGSRVFVDVEFFFLSFYYTLLVVSFFLAGWLKKKKILCGLGLWFTVPLLCICVCYSTLLFGRRRRHCSPRGRGEGCNICTARCGHSFLAWTFCCYAGRAGGMMNGRGMRD